MRPAGTVSRLIQIGLRSIGFWPGTSYAIFFRCTWILAIGIVQTFQYWYIVSRFSLKNIPQMLDTLSVTLEYTLMLFKFSILWYNRRAFYDILNIMATDWEENITAFSVHAMTSRANMSQRFSNLIISLHAAAAILYGGGVVTNSIRSNDEVNTSPREYILKMEFLSNYDESPFYEFVMIGQCIHQTMTSIMSGVLNSLMVILILHVGCQIDIMCRALMEFSSKNDDDGHTVMNTMKMLIVKHHSIITFADNIEILFTYIAMLQFLSNTLVICCLGYMIVTTLSSVQSAAEKSAMLMKSIIFYITILAESFVYCYSGEYLNAKSKLIGDSAYASFWYNLRPEQSRILLLVMLRSQRRLTITAGKIMDLSLEGFTSILKASGSYISILHAMY